MTTGGREVRREGGLVGRTLRGTYRVLRLMDQGGMGLVFEAEHLRLKTHVAVKVLPRRWTNDEHALERFKREAEMVAALRHPHIVQIIDFDATEEQQPYIVMELLSGESLASRLEREKRLPFSTAVRIAMQTAWGLAAVHQASIVHRDLKPANIFLTDLRAEGEWVKVLDFGISKQGRAARGLTGEHDVMGTADYMSPEQALGRAASADHRSDQFSLAVITYEMLSGRGAFLGRNETEILSQVISSQAPSLSLLVPGIPPRIVHAVERAMSKLPEERFPTVEAFANELAAAAGVSVPPGPAAGATLRLTSDPNVLSAAPTATEEERKRVERTNSGLRPKTPPQAPAPRAASPRDKLFAMLGRIERAFANHEIERASELVELALLGAATMQDEQALAALERTRELMLQVLEARVGNLGRRLRAEPPSPGAIQGTTPQEAFLLANIEDGFTLEELIDASPLNRFETLRLIARLMRSGRLV